MSLRTRLAVASLIIAVAGVTSGALIGQTPMLAKSAVGGLGDERAFDPFEHVADIGPEPTPDHYAIETPEGRFEVAELSSRGIYRNRRASRYDRAYEMEMDALRADLDEEWQPDPQFAAAEWEQASRRGMTMDAAIELASDGRSVSKKADIETPVVATNASDRQTIASPTTNQSEVRVIRGSEPLTAVGAEPVTLP